MRRRFRTTNPTLALGWVRDRYSRCASWTAVPAAFVFEHRELDGGSFAISNVHHRGGLAMDVDPHDALVATYLLDGRYSTAHREEVVELDPGQTALYPAATRCRVRWDDLSMEAVHLDRLAAAEAVGGKGADIVTLDNRPISAARARSWHSLVRHVAREMLSSAGTMSSPLVSKSAFGLLAATFTQTFPCRIPSFSRRYAVSNHSAVVMRACEFIESHAGESVGLAEIAEAARIGPRGLQVAFRRHLDVTPTEYLRRVRLDRAHHHLAIGDPQFDTVGRIAARWGFANSSRFAKTYREYYGCSPYVTLRS